MTLREIDIDRKMDDLYAIIVTLIYVASAFAAGTAGWLTPNGAMMVVAGGAGPFGFVAKVVITYYRDRKRWAMHEDDFYCRPLDEFPPERHKSDD